MEAFHWVDLSVAARTVPSSAVQGGVDMDGATIFVGQAYHENDLLPAKIIPSRQAAYVAYDGHEHQVQQYQVLCQKNLEWVQSRGGHVPPEAVQGGRTSGGETLYIGRVGHNGTKTVGKIHPSHKVCYIPFDGKEFSYPDYEVLVLH